ncbi:MAG: 4-hydroxy-tetrahydrodipicolinate reductase, partial [Pseudomonadota bacterium]
MAEKTPIAVVGCSGRMGQMLIQAIDERDDCELSGVTERSGHDWVGNDLGAAMGGTARGITVSDDPLEVFARSRAVLDFTAPAATVPPGIRAPQSPRVP